MNSRGGPRIVPDLHELAALPTALNEGEASVLDALIRLGPEWHVFHGRYDVWNPRYQGLRGAQLQGMGVPSSRLRPPHRGELVLYIAMYA